MKKYFFIAAALVSLNAYGQVGNPFPELLAENLNNEDVTFPNDSIKKCTLFVLAFSMSSEQRLNDWYSTIYNHFIRKNHEDLMNVHHDMDVYFIPVVTGAKRVGYKGTMTKVSDNMDERLRPHVLFFKGGGKAYKKAMEYTPEFDVPHFIVVDQKGLMQKLVRGDFSEDKMQELLDAVNEVYTMGD